MHLGGLNVKILLLMYICFTFRGERGLTNIFYIKGRSKFLLKVVVYFEILMQSKSEKEPMVFVVKSRVKTWQVRGIWSRQLEQKQVPKGGGRAEPGVTFIL